MDRWLVGLRAAAISLGAIIFALSGLAVWHASEQAQQVAAPKRAGAEQQQGQADRRVQAEGEPRARSNRPPAPNLHSDPKRRDRTQEGQDHDYGKLTDWLLIVFNALLAVFTFMLWRSTDKLWDAGERQIKAARKSAKAAQASADIAREAVIASNRAWVRLSDCQAAFDLKVSEAGISTVIGLQFKNIGNAPASNVTAWVRLGVMRSDHRHIEIFNRECAEVIKYPPPGETFLFPGDTTPEQNVIGYPIRIDRKDFEPFVSQFDGKDFVVPLVLGCVFYRFPTSGTKYHQTRFVLELAPHAFEPVWAAPHVVPKEKLMARPYNGGEGQYAD